MPRDGENLFRRGRIWYFKYKAADGKYHEQTTGIAKKADARLVRDEFLSRVRAGQVPNEMRKWTLQRAIEEHLRMRQVQRPKSYRSARPCLMAVQKLLGPHKRLDTIANYDLENYQVTRLQCPTRAGNTVEPRTVNLEVLYLSQILKKAKLWTRLREDYRPLPVDQESVGQAITSDQFLVLVQTALSDGSWLVALCAAILAACATGLRGGEIKQLKLSNLRLVGDEPSLVVPRKITKSNAGNRIYPLNAFALWAVAKLVERANLLGRWTPTTICFRRIDPNIPGPPILDAANVVMIPPTTKPHGTRHG